MIKGGLPLALEVWELKRDALSFAQLYRVKNSRA